MNPEITIDPNPAIEGSIVQISLPGPGPWYISLDPNVDGQRLTLVGNVAEIMAPGVGGQTFTVMSLGSPMVSAGFDIVAPNP